MQLDQFGLVVEQVEGGRRAGHVQPDHGLGLGGVVGLLGGQRVDQLGGGGRVDEAHARVIHTLREWNVSVDEAFFLGGLPKEKMHCSVMAYDVIKAAAASFKGVDAASFEDEIIVCECARVSLGTIKEVIKINNLTTVEEITNYTKAGAFCKSCVKPGGHEDREYYLVDILKDTRAEMEHDRLLALSNAKISGSHTISFEEMTVVQKLKEIEAVIDENIRPMLVMDGGNMEILDIKDGDGGVTDVYIRYLGACSGCASSSTGTLFAIEAVLQEKLSKNIRILPI